MSGYDINPFADPVKVNPFQDPAVTQITSGGHGNLKEFNSFSENSHLTTNQKTLPVQPVIPSEPAVLQLSTEPSYQVVAVIAEASLLQQQEELDRKPAEIEQKRKEMMTVNINLRKDKLSSSSYKVSHQTMLLPGLLSRYSS
ncbi:unnamed protein product [Ranitomeya imitator]|uniref:Uncharacterized protein n=1 Tax=Ranitomeya imitator TaxID=111125 RepID=A0ABN9M9L2_9NEOB|nr:unnamed protein product [Ranitomeya imitator]